jgi:hypothetical protein
MEEALADERHIPVVPHRLHEAVGADVAARRLHKLHVADVVDFADPLQVVGQK